MDKKLSSLRALFATHNIQAYIVPSEDSHQSEYLADCDKRRQFITGFSGSAGLAVITTSKAALWTDGRYFLQASKQLDPAHWQLMKMGIEGTPTKEEWLSKELEKGARVGIDPQLITFAASNILRDQLQKSSQTLVPISSNLIDKIWDTRPSRTSNPLIQLGVEYAGKSIAEKISFVQQKCVDKNRLGLVVSALDEIAWLLNLRGSDIDYNPVFFAFAIVLAKPITINSYKAYVILYTDSSRVDANVKTYLYQNGVKLEDYGNVVDGLKSVVGQLREAEVSSGGNSEKMWVDGKCSLALVDAIGLERIEEEKSPILLAKAVKNETEIEGFRQSHIRDAAALCNFFAWMEDQLLVQKNEISEVDAADAAYRFRSEQDKFMGLSFDTISSTGPNGSIIHYKPEKDACSIVNPDQIYLIDSGGQYLDGTTDITRTYHFKTPTREEKNAFTRVLQGHIGIDLTIFPKGTTGYILDSIARRMLWRDGLDYLHGTGHGVGHFLNVHEGPQGIGTRIVFNDTALEPGMVLSNEPGYYEDGVYGIRIESLVAVKKVKTKYNFGNRDYYGFEHFTVVPIQTKLINKDLLTVEEIKWINDYNSECFAKVKGLLKVGSPGYKWLERECEPF